MKQRKFRQPFSVMPIYKMFNGQKYQQMGIYPNNDLMLYDLQRWATKHNILLKIENCEMKNKVRLWSRPK